MRHTDATLISIGAVSDGMRDYLERGGGPHGVLDVPVGDVKWKSFLTPTLFQGVADIDLVNVRARQRARPLPYRDLSAAAGGLVNGLVRCA